MKMWFRSTALTATLALLLGGPLAPMGSAQQPATSGQADVMQEALKASARSDADKTLYDIGAGAVNLFHVPGKTVVCGLSVLVSAPVLFITFGTAYKLMSEMVHEGCGGKWVLRGDDLRSEPRSNAFEWESQMREP